MSEENEIQTEEAIELPLTEEPLIARDEQKVHSWSRINTFETCPHLYKEIYLNKRKGEIPPIMLIGRVAHDAIDKYVKHCVQNKIEHDYDKWEEFAWKALEKENLPAQYHKQVLDLVKSYADTHTIDLESVLGAEEKIAINRNFEEVDWMAEDVWFRSILDYVQIQGNIAKITDYKTGWLMKADPFQLEIYAWIIKKIYPQVMYFQIEIDFVRHEFQKLFTITDEDIEVIEKKLFNRIAHIEKETKFEPKVGIQCASCPVWAGCPAMKPSSVNIMFKMPTNVGEATLLALEVEKLSRLASEAKKILKEYCDNAGPLEAGGRTYEFKTSTSYEFGKSLNDLYVELDALGIDLMEYVNVDNRKLKVLMRNEAIEKIVKRLGHKDVSVRFSDSKTKAEESEG